MKDWWKEDEPKHEHDCDSCVFVGIAAWHNGDKLTGADLYVCAKGESLWQDNSVIARFSSEGSDYCSYPLSIAIRVACESNRSDFNTMYTRMAIRRAIREGILSDEILANALKSELGV